jgi:hypothetical protein
LPLEAVDVAIQPRFSGRGPKSAGLTLEATAPGAPPLRRDFGLTVVHDAALQLAQQLAEQQKLDLAEQFEYDLLAEPLPTATVGEAGFSVTLEPRPLAVISAPLAPLVDRAEAVGTGQSDDVPVFFTRQAAARAEFYSRRGAEQQPAVESGAVLVGVLGTCPESGELFVVVLDALEASDAEHAQFSLAYTGKTWARLQQVLLARQAKHPALRMLGQCHGHNFLPAGGAPPCERCASEPVCPRTSVFVSVDDRSWSRAVLARQPWQLCQIFGLNARGEPVSGLFGLRDNRLQPRQHYLIDSFEWPVPQS